MPHSVERPRRVVSAIVWCMSETTPAPRAYVLGGELRHARENAGIGVRQLAGKLELSHSVIVRWEKGERLPSPESVSAVAVALGLSAAERDRLVQAAKDAASEPVNSVSIGVAGMADALTTLMGFERAATSITDVSPLLVPGLLQTADYARMVIGDSPDAEARVAVRLGRRDVITRERNPVQYTAYILESVLYQQVGESLLVDQLRMMRKLADLPNVCIRVIPDDVVFTPAHMGPYVLLEFDKAAPVVHLEHLRSSVFLRDADDVEVYKEARAELDRMAMSPTDSIRFIADVIDKVETTE